MGKRSRRRRFVVPFVVTVGCGGATPAAPPDRAVAAAAAGGDDAGVAVDPAVDPASDPAIDPTTPADPAVELAASDGADDAPPPPPLNPPPPPNPPRTLTGRVVNRLHTGRGAELVIALGTDDGIDERWTGALLDADDERVSEERFPLTRVRAHDARITATTLREADVERVAKVRLYPPE